MYTWYFGDGTSWQNAANASTGHSYTQAGEYDVTLVATYQDVCKDVITKYHAVIMDFCEYYAPSAFTPNGDGHNDRFMPIGYNVSKLAYLKIYDRWGKVAYLEESILVNGINGWDGNINGQPAPEGVYVFETQLIYIDNSPSEIKRGTVSLIR